MAIVYLHSKPDGEIFYVGISKDIYRPYSFRNRNKYWHNVVNKYGYIVNILFKDIEYSEAIEIEKYLIFYYGRKCLNTGTLVNITDGGEGVVGMKRTEETKLKMSLTRKGEIWSEQRRINHNLACKTRVLSAQTRLNMSKNNAKTKSKKVINTETNIIYSSLVDACKDLGLKYTTTRAKLSGQNQNNTNLKYI